MACSMERAKENACVFEEGTSGAEKTKRLYKYKGKEINLRKWVGRKSGIVFFVEEINLTVKNAMLNDST